MRPSPSALATARECALVMASTGSRRRLPSCATRSAGEPPLCLLVHRAIDNDIVEGAMNEHDRGLRSFDAIHLATARILGDDLSAIAGYGDRLLKAAADAGLGTASPRD